MAWSATPTETAGAVGTAANQNIKRDNLDALRAGAIAIAAQANLDLIIATGASQFGRVAKGTALQHPRIDAAGTAYEFTTLVPSISVQGSQFEALVAGITRYQSLVSVGPGLVATEGNIDIKCPHAGKLSDLRCLTQTLVGAGETIVFTVRKNAANTALTATVGGGASAEAEDIVNTVTFAKDDKLTMQLVSSAGAATTLGNWSLVLEWT